MSSGTQHLALILRLRAKSRPRTRHHFGKPVLSEAEVLSVDSAKGLGMGGALFSLHHPRFFTRLRRIQNDVLYKALIFFSLACCRAAGIEAHTEADSIGGML